MKKPRVHNDSRCRLNAMEKSKCCVDNICCIPQIEVLVESVDLGRKASQVVVVQGVKVESVELLVELGSEVDYLEEYNLEYLLIYQLYNVLEKTGTTARVLESCIACMAKSMGDWQSPWGNCLVWGWEYAGGAGPCGAEAS